MAGTVRVFDCDIDTNGAYAFIRKEPICPGCVTDGEVDAQIKLLKDDLDAVAVRMKSLIQKNKVKPLGLETTSNA